MNISSDKDGPNFESSSSGIHWSSILGGAAVAAAVSVMLIPLGSAFGLGSFSVFTAKPDTAVVFTVGMAIWLVVMQWISAGLGGYIAGRLRVKWADLHSDEVFFRDTAHGFIAWAAATLLTAALLAGAGASALGTAGKAAATMVPGMDYYSDMMFRGSSAPSPEATAEAGRILAHDLKDGSVSDSDKAYLDSLVAAHTGLDTTQADQRVSATLNDIEAAKQKMAQTAEATRKAMVGFFTALFISLLVGAFIASVSAAIGGRLRDQV
ncbi:hypothetical protein [Asticcacaulis sp. EMRT-3]|uniref:hypothetical protein n=1 Tax=Asticcacaulis sp. EMRT-3 TaxID=3040349 RepID=UPI0024AF7AF5|nr:hypothetical protein [Asticcacaulis sp. EMRT-3]MDI7775287.1 hypothetical protein [Asticcacaulis sp. EMRT-3]